jgi:hypothetical protein
MRLAPPYSMVWPFEIARICSSLTLRDCLAVTLEQLSRNPQSHKASHRQVTSLGPIRDAPMGKCCYHVLRVNNTCT